MRSLNESNDTLDQRYLFNPEIHAKVRQLNNLTALGQYNTLMSKIQKGWN